MKFYDADNQFPFPSNGSAQLNYPGNPVSILEILLEFPSLQTG